MTMVFFDLHITLTCYIRVHRAGSQLKMSESQTKAGNQKKIKEMKTNNQLLAGTSSMNGNVSGYGADDDVQKYTLPFSTINSDF